MVLLVPVAGVIMEPEYVGKDQYGYEYIKDGTKISEAVKTVRATMK